MIRIVLYRVNGEGEWTEGVLHSFNDCNAIVENKASGELLLVGVDPAKLKFKNTTDEWVRMQVEAQQRAQIQGVTAPNIAQIRR